jgi:hypothetical protein
MKKIYLLALGVVASAASFAQTELKAQNDGSPLHFVGEATLKVEGNVDAARGTETCSDTNRWAWGRSFDATGATYYSTFMHSDTLVPNSYGTYVPVPANQSVDVSGFSFYAVSLRPDNGSVTVNAVLYAAGADSLPMGAALATVAVTVDTSTTGFINPMLQEVMFPSAITVNGGFIISVENSTVQGDSIQVIRGYTGSGSADNFPSLYQAIDLSGGNYVRLPGTNFGARLPHYYPYVSFSQTNDFTMSVSKLSGANQSVDFSYDGPAATDHPFFSISGFVGQVTSSWNFQDGSSIVSARDTAHVFANETKDYQVMLTDSIVLWDGSVCVLTQSHLLEKFGPLGINDAASSKIKAYVSNDVIRVDNAQGLATIYSITGQVVRKVYLSGSEQTINVSDLENGVYILSVNDQAIKLNL